MRVLPAIDIRDRAVVRGVGGRRDAYQPLVSRLAADARPASVARGLIDMLGLAEFYVADLTAIAGAEPQWDVYRELIAEGASLWIDAGLTDPARVDALIEFAAATEPGITGIIAGSESLKSADVLRRLVERAGPRRAIFSLDLVSGTPRVAAEEWSGHGPRDLAEAAVAAGIERMIVLDVRDVGSSGGCSALELCEQLRHDHPALELISGGGVRDAKDLSALGAAGCRAALVASALHDGRITADDLAAWQARALDDGWPISTVGIGPSAR